MDARTIKKALAARWPGVKFRVRKPTGTGLYGWTWDVYGPASLPYQEVKEFVGGVTDDQPQYIHYCPEFEATDSLNLLEAQGE